MPNTDHYFHLYLINPSRYGEDGYVVFWHHPPLPNNTLACLNALALDCARRQVLGAGVRIEVTVWDETADPIPLEEIKARISAGSGLVGLTGVQSHQYPRALDLARQLRAFGIPVCIGGFHVSGVLGMFGQPTPELEEALSLGVSLFIGEAEGGRLEQVLSDAWAGTMQPIYGQPLQPPDLGGEPGPTLPVRLLRQTRSIAPLDTGRGCPFTCSFCTIINVHGHGGRQRRVEDVLATLRAYLDQGVQFFQITDDNFARLDNWREMLMAIAELRTERYDSFGLLIQVDVPSYHNRDFVQLCARAGVKFVFIGVESINSDNLRQISKPQNRVERYREMYRAWRDASIHVQAGYIIGFPNDTPDTIVHDVAYLLDEVGFDDLMLFYLTPLPGSVDHRDRVRHGEWMDPDLNRYNLHHPVTRHPVMSTAQWRRAYRNAWKALLDYRRIPGYLRAAQADGLDTRLVFSRMLGYHMAVFCHDIHPIEYGWGLRKFQDQRRPGRLLDPGFRLRQWYDAIVVETYTRYLHWRIGRIYRQFTESEPPPRSVLPSES